MRRKRYQTTTITGTPPALVAFSDSFVNLNNWIVSNWGAPGGGKFDATHVDVALGMLRLKLTQDGTTAGSVGGEVQCRQKFGYGSYRFVARMGSTSATPDGLGFAVSGQISAVWNYLPDASYNSVTEIDGPEIEGNKPDHLSYTSWTNGQRDSYTPVLAPMSPDLGFHEYRFDWVAGEIAFYFDGVLTAVHQVNVPIQAAYPMINFWGTNSLGWGGLATPGTRYMYVKSFTFSPL